MGRRVSIDGLADAVMQELDNYADTTADGVDLGGSSGTDRPLRQKLADQNHEGKLLRSGDYCVFPDKVYAGASAGARARHA